MSCTETAIERAIESYVSGNRRIFYMANQAEINEKRSRDSAGEQVR